MKKNLANHQNIKLLKKYNFALFCRGMSGLEVLKSLYKRVNFIIVIITNDDIEILNFLNSNQLNYLIWEDAKSISSQFFQFKVGIDFLISVNFPYILNKNMLSIPKKCSLNIHGSYLPKYRGSAPIIWALINGEKNAGVTVHKMDSGIDTGDIIIQEKFDIPKKATGYEVIKFAIDKYPKLIIRAVVKLIRNKNTFLKQNNKYSSYFPKRSEKENQINWENKSLNIYNFVRALAKPLPGSYTFLEKKKIFINEIDTINKNNLKKYPPGTILYFFNKDPVIQSLDGSVRLINYYPKFNNKDLGKVLK